MISFPLPIASACSWFTTQGLKLLKCKSKKISPHLSCGHRYLVPVKESDQEEDAGGSLGHPHSSLHLPPCDSGSSLPGSQTDPLPEPSSPESSEDAGGEGSKDKCLWEGARGHRTGSDMVRAPGLHWRVWSCCWAVGLHANEHPESQGSGRRGKTGVGVRRTEEVKVRPHSLL